jgi:hypothetical protein
MRAMTGVRAVIPDSIVFALIRSRLEQQGVDSGLCQLDAV